MRADRWEGWRSAAENSAELANRIANTGSVTRPGSVRIYRSRAVIWVGVHPFRTIIPCQDSGGVQGGAPSRKPAREQATDVDKPVPARGWPPPRSANKSPTTKREIANREAFDRWAFAPLRDDLETAPEHEGWRKMFGGSE